MEKLAGHAGHYADWSGAVQGAGSIMHIQPPIFHSPTTTAPTVNSAELQMPAMNISERPGSGVGAEKCQRRFTLTVWHTPGGNNSACHHPCHGARDPKWIIIAYFRIEEASTVKMLKYLYDTKTATQKVKNWVVFDQVKFPPPSPSRSHLLWLQCIIVCTGREKQWPVVNCALKVVSHLCNLVNLVNLVEWIIQFDRNQLHSMSLKCISKTLRSLSWDDSVCVCSLLHNVLHSVHFVFCVFCNLCVSTMYIVHFAEMAPRRSATEEIQVAWAKSHLSEWIVVQAYKWLSPLTPASAVGALQCSVTIRRRTHPPLPEQMLLCWNDKSIKTRQQ